MTKLFHKTKYGEIICGDSIEMLSGMESGSVNLVMTSPPFGLVRKKEYGNVDADSYLDWFRPFASEFLRVLSDNGSLVIDIGGSWNKGLPTRNLYHFKLPIMLCEEFGFHLAQEFYWWNPAKLPSPAEWVNIRRIRVKDAVNTVWWLSKTPYPKASNRRVLQSYSDRMESLLSDGYVPKLRPSGHDISDKFSKDNGGSIPPNLIAIANTESNGKYVRYCREKGIKPHPARFPSDLPEFFVRMLTDVDDMVVDPFGGSCVTGEVCEKLHRRWKCCDTMLPYLEGAVGRFVGESSETGARKNASYSISRPGLFWNGIPEDVLSADGGRERNGKTAILTDSTGPLD